MEKIGEKIIASEGKTILRKADNYFLGKAFEVYKTWYINEQKLDRAVTVDIDDVYEVDDTEIDGMVSINGCFWKLSKDYSKDKAFIVKLKYSNDDQIALMLNYQEKPDEYKERYDAMQAWRDYAGEVARKYSNV